jgi:hypothetical protein
MKQEGAQDNPRSIVGLFAWGDVWEDFYGTIGVSFEQFCESFTGSWQFGLVAALQEVGIDVVIYYFSGTVSDVIRVPHKPSGATICMMPTPTQYRKLYNRMVHPHHSLGYWGSLEGLFGDVGSKRILFEAARQIAPYLATPLGWFRAEIRRDGCRALICQDYEGPHFDQAAVMGKLGELCLAMHPQLTGRPSRLAALEDLIRHILAHPKVWFARCDDVAAAVRPILKAEAGR